MAHDVLLDEDCWIKGYAATDDRGVECSTSSPHACHFCAVGAIAFVVGVPSTYGVDAYRHEQHNNAVEALADVIAPSYVVPGAGQRVSTFNDSIETTHADVLSAFATAIERIR